MARFSVSGAATAGFGVIGRAPLAVLAWGLVILVTLVGPMIGLIWAAIPQFIDFFKSMPEPGAAADPTNDPAIVARMMQLQASMMGLNALSLVVGSLVKAVVAGAAFRAVLQPEQKRWAYMRLGKSELWLALVTLVQGVLMVMAYFALVIAGFILSLIVYLAGAAMGETGKLVAGLLIALIVLAAVGVLIWGVLRLSMAGPMSWVEGQFRLFESWTFTRGQSGRLLGMVVLLALIVLALELVLYAVAGGGVLLGFATHGWGEGLVRTLESLKDQPPAAWWRALWPLIVFTATALSLLGGFAMALVYAPWAKAYKDLAASGATGG